MAQTFHGHAPRFSVLKVLDETVDVWVRRMPALLRLWAVPWFLACIATVVATTFWYVQSNGDAIPEPLYGMPWQPFAAIMDVAALMLLATGVSPPRLGLTWTRVTTAFLVIGLAMVVADWAVDSAATAVQEHIARQAVAMRMGQTEPVLPMLVAAYLVRAIKIPIGLGLAAFSLHAFETGRLSAAGAARLLMRAPLALFALAAAFGLVDSAVHWLQWRLLDATGLANWSAHFAFDRFGLISQVIMQLMISPASILAGTLGMALQATAFRALTGRALEPCDPQSPDVLR